MEDAVDDLIQQVHKMKNNFKNMAPFKEGFATQNTQSSGFDTMFPAEGLQKLKELRETQFELERVVNNLTMANSIDASTLKTAIKARDYAKKYADEFEKKLNPTVAFFQSLDPPIKYTVNEKIKFLKMIYMAVVILFNIPNLIINLIARLSYQILRNKSKKHKEKTLEEEIANYEIIRTGLVEFSYLLLTFWITYVLLDYGSTTEPSIKSKSWFTKFKWVSIGFFKVLGVILWFPTEFVIRMITTKINPAFHSLGIEEFPCVRYLLAFCVAIFFVFNFLSKCRSAFFKCFIRGDEMPKASWQVHLLIAFAYLSNYMGVNFVNVAMWYISTLTRFISFLFHVIISHLLASIAQFTLTIWLLWLFVRYLPSPPISKIHEEMSASREESCKTDKSSILGQIEKFLGTWAFTNLGTGWKYTDFTCFTIFIWMLWFMYRMQKIELASDKNIRVLTGVFNTLGIIVSFFYILYIHFKGIILRTSGFAKKLTIEVN